MELESGGKLAVPVEIEKKQWRDPNTPGGSHTWVWPPALIPAGLVVLRHQSYSHMQMSQAHRPTWIQSYLELSTSGLSYLREASTCQCLFAVFHTAKFVTRDKIR